MKNKILGFFLLILLFASLCACQKEEKQVVEAGKGEILLYYLNTNENGLVKVAKKMDLSEDPYEAVIQVLKKLKSVEKEDGYDYHALLNKQISYSQVTVSKEGKAVIDFGAGYEQLSSSKEILVRAGIVRSLVQIEGVNEVEFTIDEVPLADQNGIYVGSMNAEDFIMDTDKKAVYDNEETVTLYMSNWDGDRLIQVEVDLQAKDNQSIEEAALEALKSPHGEGTKSPIPDNLVFNHINVIQNICYVDLSEEVMDSIKGISEEVKIYSMVNTLTALTRVSQVQFTINGEVVSEVNDVESFDIPMTHDYALDSDEVIY